MTQFIQINTIEELQAHQEQLNGNKVLIDVAAAWCNPCKAVWALLQNAEGELLDKQFTLFKLNLDNDDITTAVKEQYGITNIPTLIVKKDGETTQYVGSKITLPLLRSL